MWRWSVAWTLVSSYALLPISVYIHIISQASYYVLGVYGDERDIILTFIIALNWSSAPLQAYNWHMYRLIQW